MTILEYEARFHYLARHVSPILTIEYERVGCFVCILRISLCMYTQILVTIGRYFAKDYDHAQVMAKMHCEAQEGSDKRSYYPGSFSGICSVSQFKGSGS